MRKRAELLERAQDFSSRLGRYLDTIEPKDYSDRFAVEWLRENLVNTDQFDTILQNETQGKPVYLREPALLVTPGTGRTTGIVALFWVWLVAQERITLGASRQDTFLRDFIMTAFDEEEVGLIPALSSFNDDHLQEITRSHGTIIVYGSDNTVERFRSFSLPDTRFVGYGSKFSVGVHFGPISHSDLDGYFRDLVLYDGLGCLSTSILYLESLTDHNREQLNRLSTRILTYYQGNSSASHFQTQFSHSVFELDHKVLSPIFSLRELDESQTPLPMGFGTLYVVDLDGWANGLAADLRQYRRYLSSLTVGGDLTDKHSNLVEVGFQRIVQVGQAQNPPLSWSHDGQGNLTSFVTLIDVE